MQLGDWNNITYKNKWLAYIPMQKTKVNQIQLNQSKMHCHGCGNRGDFRNYDIK